MHLWSERSALWRLVAALLVAIALVAALPSWSSKNGIGTVTVLDA